MAYPRFITSRAHKIVTDFSLSTFTFTTTTPTQIDASLDIVLAAQVGDDIMCTVAGYWNGSTVTYSGVIDIKSITSGRYHSNGTTTAQALGCPCWASGGSATGSGRDTPFGGSWTRAVVADDLASGVITLRPMGFLSSAGTYSLSQTGGFFFQAINLGPADPN